MILTYSGKSRPSALAIEDVSDGEIEARRGSRGDINWGRAFANTALNPDISSVTNKRIMRELFKEHDVPMPKLYPVIERGIVELDTDWLPLVGRPDTHMKGRGFWVCHTYSDVRRAIRGTRKKKAATHFMEYVDAPHEYRVHIFKGKSIRISEKLQGEYGETAHGNYTTIKPTGNIRHVRKAAKQAVDSVGLDFGAVDILADDSNCWVLEVNAAPGLGGTMPRVYAETFKKWNEGEA